MRIGMRPNLQVYVVHRTKHRLRVKIPAQRHQQHYFAALQRALSERASVRLVEVNPLTASVLINHDGTFDCRELQQLFGPAVAPASIAEARRLAVLSAIGRLDGAVRNLFGKETGLVALIWRLARAAIRRQWASQLTSLAAKAVLQAILSSARSGQTAAPSLMLEAA
jgi:hypothetical protein